MIVSFKRNKYIQYLQLRGATSPGKAVQLEAADIERSLLFNRLVRSGIIKEAYNFHYYVDVEVEKKQRLIRRTVIQLVCIIVVSLLIVMIILLDYITGDRILMIRNW